MMDEGACREIEDLLALRPEDRTTEEHRRVEAHLRDCADCRALAETDAEQERLLRAMPPLRLTPAGRHRLYARIARERGRGAVRARLSTALGTAAGVAALAALGFALYVLFRQDGLPAEQVEMTGAISEHVTPIFPQVTEPPVTPTPQFAAPLFAGEIAFLGGVVQGESGETTPFPPAASETASTRLLGRYTPPSTVVLQLEWHKPANSSTRWSIFLHLMDEAGQLAAQSDQASMECVVPGGPEEPCDKHFSQHELTLPAGLAPSLYTLYAGLYDPLTGERATLTTPAGAADPENRVTLGQVELLAGQEVSAQTDEAWLRDMLEAYEPGQAEGVATQLAAWLSAGNDPAALEQMLRDLQPAPSAEPEVRVTDLNGDGREDVAVETQQTGLPVVVCLGQAGGAYAGRALPEAFPGGYLAIMQGDIRVEELTGEAPPELLVSYVLPGGSGSTELLYVYRWDEAGEALIFNAALITWAGTSSWALAPDAEQPGAQQIVLTYPHLYGDGFDHKLLNHPLARQIWRWDGAAGHFTLAEETIRQPHMSWGPQPQETPEDWLRWTVNEGEEAFRAGDYTVALEQYDQVLGMTEAQTWTPQGEQPDWAGYARFRRAETLALLGRDAEAAEEMRVLAEDYAGDMLGELAASFLSGYADASAGIFDAVARAVAAIQGVDLYGHLYYERGGALRFPIQAEGVLYPGAGPAAYLDAHAELIGDSVALLSGLRAAGFDATEVNVAAREIRVTLRLPQAPNAEGALAVWRLASDGGRWRVAPTQPAGAQPGSLVEPGWPQVGGLDGPRYAPQTVTEPGSETPTEETPDSTPAPTPEARRFPAAAGDWVALLDMPGYSG